jgi:ankyrin repeat protein
MNKSINIALILILVSGSLFNVRGDDECFGLLKAAQKDNTDEILNFLGEGCDVDTTDNDNMTALMMAASEGNMNSIKLLIDNLAEIDAKGFMSKETALMMAARYGHKKAVELLIDNDADINSTNGLGFTALMIAADEGRLEMVEVLIDKEADLTIELNTGETALDIAKRKGHDKVIKILRKAIEGE